MGRVIILAGAPDAASLDWTALDGGGDVCGTAGQASAHPQWRAVPAGDGRAADALPELSSGHVDDASQSQSQGDIAHLPSFDEASLSVRLPNALPASPTPSGRGAAAAADSLLLPANSMSQDFLQHSLAVHDALPSSLPEDPPSSVAGGSSAAWVADLDGSQQRHGHDAAAGVVGASSGTPSLDSTASTSSATCSLSLHLPMPPLPATVPRWQPRTRLADVPGAADILRLVPQTLTANLVVAVVSVGEPRAIKSSRDNSNNSNNNNNNNNNRLPPRHRRPVSLVELVVGDESRAGFVITVWVDDGGAGPAASTAEGSGAESLAAVLPTLRPQDVVLLRHVALHVFGDKVYGSSLRRDQTKAHVLHRGGRRDSGSLFAAAHIAGAASATSTAGHDPASSTQRNASAWPLLATTARVREWALQYVVVDGGGSQGSLAAEDDRVAGGQAVRQAWTRPPADTQ